MKIIMYYWSAIISVLLSAGYLVLATLDLPGAFEAFILLIFWSMIAWIAGVAYLIIALVKLLKKDDDWKRYAISALVTASTYLALWGGMKLGYHPTV